MEHPYRDWIRTKFGEYVGTGPLARNCERNILNWTVKKVPLSEATWESKLFCLTYKRKAIWLLTEFKRRSMVKVKLSVEGGEVKVKLVLVSQLADRLKKKELESTKLAWYSPDILDPEGPYSAVMFKLKKKDNDQEKAKALANEDYVGQFKCGKCKSRKTTYYQLQTRSADEPSALLGVYSYLFSTDFLSSDNLRDLHGVQQPLEVLELFCNTIVPMARTRITLNSTKFLNSKRRVIGMTANGKYAARTEKGGLTYNPKAKYVKSPGGTERTLLNSKANVPMAIRPKMVRKARSNAGAKRAPRAGVRAGNLARLFSSPHSPKRRGRPPKPGGPKKYVRKEGLRKERSNKGMKRGSRKEKAMFARLMAPLN